MPRKKPRRRRNNVNEQDLHSETPEFDSLNEPDAVQQELDQVELGC